MTEFGGLKRAATTFGSIRQREAEGGFGERVGTRQAVVEEDDAAGVKPFCDATHNDVARLEALPEHSFGLRSLFPLWALTGLKFVFPQLINFPIYVDKKELTTL